MLFRSQGPQALIHRHLAFMARDGPPHDVRVAGRVDHGSHRPFRPGSSLTLDTIYRACQFFQCGLVSAPFTACPGQVVQLRHGMRRMLLRAWMRPTGLSGIHNSRRRQLRNCNVIRMPITAIGPERQHDIRPHSPDV